MATTIASYYADELDLWNESIAFYNEETEELNKKLTEVIRRNSILDIAAKVEVHQLLLSKVSAKFEELQGLFHHQQEELIKNNEPVEDAFINFETEKLQTDLRSRMQETEKEYVDAKFDCYSFLSAILKK